MADADDETTTAPPPPAAPAPTAATPDMLAQAQQLAQQFLPAPVQVDTTPVKRSWLSLLGEAVGGGKQIPMSPADEQRAGLRALGDFGTSLMAASHYQPGQTVFSNLAQGFQGAERSMTGSEQMAAGTLAAQQGYQQQQLQNRLAALKEAIPLLRMQQAAGLPNPLAGGGGAPGGGNLAATGDPIAALPKNDALPAIVQRESGGQNINTRILGPDGKPASTASGYYQMLDGTWQEGAALAGIKNPPARAIDASKADQDAAASALFDKHGYAPWAKSAPVAPTTTAAAPSAPTTPPSPLARPTAAPAAPAGTIQGTPDSGGTQVGGPGALPGVIRPPGPLVPGDVGAIVGGMTKAGASPTTLAPGGGTAAPTAPTIAQGGPPTVTPPAQPTPQATTQGDQPPAPGGPLTIEQYRAQHPSVINPSTYTVTPPGLADALAAKQTFAQNLQSARAAGDITGANKAAADYQTASQNVATLQQQAQAKSLELQQAAQKNADDLTLQGYNAEMQRQQEAQLKAQELAQTAAENEKNRQADIRKAELGAGYTAQQKQADADIDIAKNDITDRAAEAQKASRIIPVLQQMQGQFGNLPTGFVGGLLAKYDTTGDITGMLARMGVVDPSKATAAQLLIAARNYLSIETKPAATGSLRIAEMDKLQSFTPGQLDTPQAQQEMIGRLIAYQKRIQDERTFAGNYFGRTDPTTGKRIYDNRGLDTAMNAPVQYDQNGVVTGGGLGPVVPEPPPLNRPDAEHQAYLNYIHRNVAPGMPYQSWEPKTNANGSTARDAQGQPIPQRVTKMQGYQ